MRLDGVDVIAGIAAMATVFAPVSLWCYSRRTSSIHDAAESGDVKRVMQCLARGVHIDEKDEYGRTALHVAIEHGVFDVAAHLLSEGADPSIVDGVGRTPVSLLMNANPECRHADPSGWQHLVDTIGLGNTK